MQLTYDNLVDANGNINLRIYIAMVRRRCMAEYGAITPKAIRNAVDHYGDVIAILKNRRREALGLPRIALASSEIRPYGVVGEGVRREAF